MNDRNARGINASGGRGYQIGNNNTQNNNWGGVSCAFCNVPPIGTCSECGEAFCGTHQAEGRYIDWCSVCRARAWAPSRAAARENQSAESYLTDSAGRDLIAAGARLVDIYSVKTNVARKSFGRSAVNESTELWGKGWVLGEFRWKYHESGHGYGGYDEAGNLLTVLRQTSQRPTYWQAMFAAVRRDTARGVYLLARAYGVHGDSVTCEARELADAVHRLSRR